MSAGAPSVVVVGSGPVGATFARLLIASGAEVTMLDTGAVLSDPPGDHLANSFVFQQSPNLFMDVTAAAFETISSAAGLVRRKGAIRRNYDNPEQRFFRNMPFASAVYAVGGMSTVWTASCPVHADFELPHVLPVPTWRRLLAVADELLSVNTDTFSSSLVGAIALRRLNAGADPPRFHDLPAAAVPGTRTGTVRWSSTATILGDVRLDPSFTLLAEHRAERIEHEGGHVTGITVRDLRRDEVRTLVADHYVIAAGSFLTPRLLWKSQIRPAALGRYLHDHTQSGVRIALSKGVLDELRADPTNPARDHPIPVAHDAIGPMLSVEPTPEQPWHGQFHASGRKFLYTGGRDVREVLDISYYGMVTPRRENHITFSDTVEDRFGEPQITIHFRWSIRDLVRAARMWWDMVRSARKVGRIVSLPVLSPPGTTLHLMGTYRMGTEDERAESVTDTSSRVWGFDNLTLGGLGLIPDSNASNPTNVACAMAVQAVAELTGAGVDELVASHRAYRRPEHAA